MTDPHLNFCDLQVRLWVKNRRPITSTAIGVDLTKNWNSQWGGKYSKLFKSGWFLIAFVNILFFITVSGGSHTPSANNYIGQGPFTEVETRSLSRYIESIGSRLTGFLSFRAFGQRLLVPFAHTTDPLYNYNDMVNKFFLCLTSNF